MSEARDKIIMFGASNGGRLFISYANKSKKYEILAIADNDVSKQGTYFHGYPVIAPAEISNYEYDYIMITSIFVLQIQDQLINELKVAKSRIKAVPKNIIGKARSHRPFNDKNTIDLAKRTLLFIIDLFDANDITYFIDYGTLLGIVRDGDIIPWDDDIDISVYSHDMNKIISLLTDNTEKFPLNEKLEWEGNISYKSNGLLNSITMTFNSNNDLGIKHFTIDISANHFEDGFAYQSVSYAPERFFKSVQHINYMGRMVSVPYDYEE
ncbi:MAG: hypothetical protein GX021_10185 [Tissierellia bacterium]|nr:hypothetical protein [Tissierellia bacterium]